MQINWYANAKKLIKAQGMSIKGVCASMGHAPNWFYEMGRKPEVVKLCDLIAFSNILGISLDELVYGKVA